MIEVHERQSTGRGPEMAEFVLEISSELRIIEQVVAYLVSRCEQFSFAGSRLNLNFRVGVAEALANAVLYGNQSDPAKRVRVDVHLDDTCVVLRVADEGRGFRPADVPDPTEPENIERTGGRGIFLLYTLMDEVEYNDEGNTVRMVLHREKRVRRGTRC